MCVSTASVVTLKVIKSFILQTNDFKTLVFLEQIYSIPLGKNTSLNYFGWKSFEISEIISII